MIENMLLALLVAAAPTDAPGRREVSEHLRGCSWPRVPSGREHDYTSPRWGHAIGMMLDLSWVGHGPSNGDRMREGDAIVVEMQSGRRGRYLIESISYYSDPRDMWKANVRFAGYCEP